MKKAGVLSSNIKTVVLGIFLILYMFPFVFVLVNSFKTKKEIISNPLQIPGALSFKNYIDAFAQMNYINGFKNSLIITALSVVLIALFSSMASYLFVRSNWKINRFMFFLMVAAMIIPFQALMIPLVKIYGSFQLLNSKWTLIYMYMGFGVPLAVFMYHGFIKGIPLELDEAALIDGASRYRTFFSIIFPLLKPITMTVIILDVLWIWNDFLLPSLVLIKPEARTLPLSTFYFYGTYSVSYDLLMASLILTIIPVIILYLFLQKQILSGIVQGSIK